MPVGTEPDPARRSRRSWWPARLLAVPGVPAQVRRGGACGPAAVDAPPLASRSQAPVVSHPSYRIERIAPNAVTNAPGRPYGPGAHRIGSGSDGPALRTRSGTTRHHASQPGSQPGIATERKPRDTTRVSRGTPRRRTPATLAGATFPGGPRRCGRTAVAGPGSPSDRDRTRSKARTDGHPRGRNRLGAKPTGACRALSHGETFRRRNAAFLPTTPGRRGSDVDAEEAVHARR